MASIVPKASRSMRIIALPLTRARPSASKTSQGPSLVYYHFQIATKGSGSQGGILNWVTTKTAAMWASLGKAEEGSFKLRIYRYGERLVDRIDFEELALKSIDPSLGPRLTSPDFRGKRHESKAEGEAGLVIPLIYPSSIVLSHPIVNVSADLEARRHPSLVHLQSLLSTRIPRHRKGFVTWALIAPLTAPIALIPLVPNLPFLFCAWRSWSHYRAYRASQYLDRLLSSGAILPHASPELDRVYMVVEAAKGNGATLIRGDGERKEDKLLLARDVIPRILSIFDLPSSASTDLYRAMEQAKMRVGGT